MRRAQILHYQFACLTEIEVDRHKKLVGVKVVSRWLNDGFNFNELNWNDA
jgi:hypothetical protein